MESTSREGQLAAEMNVRNLIREAIREFAAAEQSRTEPAYKTELLEERKRREQLEKRLNEVVEENRRSRAATEELERQSQIRSELQRIGVLKVDLAFRALKEDVRRAEDGRLVGRTEAGEMPLREYVASFVAENPELLPTRIAGGSGAAAPEKSSMISQSVDLDRIKPGMNPEELDRVRKEIARLAGQSMNGL
jgi:hypothetical protein